MTQEDTQCNSRCPSCGHKILGPGVKLSSIEFRRKINSITNIKELDDHKDYLIQFLKNRFRITSYIDKFFNGLNNQLNNPINIIKTWILKYPGLLGKDPESPLYDLIHLNYSAPSGAWSDGIDTTFHDFYQSYVNFCETLCKSDKVSKPLSKNHISRALNALGIKPIMKKIKLDNNEKKNPYQNNITSVMMVCITKEKLSEVLKKNGFTLPVSQT